MTSVLESILVWEFLSFLAVAWVYNDPALGMGLLVLKKCIYVNNPYNLLIRLRLMKYFFFACRYFGFPGLMGITRIEVTSSCFDWMYKVFR